MFVVKQLKLSGSTSFNQHKYSSRFVARCIQSHLVRSVCACRTDIFSRNVTLETIEIAGNGLVDEKGKIVKCCKSFSYLGRSSCIVIRYSVSVINNILSLSVIAVILTKRRTQSMLNDLFFEICARFERFWGTLERCFSVLFSVWGPRGNWAGRHLYRFSRGFVGGAGISARSISPFHKCTCPSRGGAKGGGPRGRRAVLP